MAQDTKKPEGTRVPEKLSTDVRQQGEELERVPWIEVERAVLEERQSRLEHQLE